MAPASLQMFDLYGEAKDNYKLLITWFSDSFLCINSSCKHSQCL